MQTLFAKTERLVLRPFLKDDYEAWRADCIGRGPKRNEFDRGPVPKRQLTRAEFERARRLLERAQERDIFYSFGIFHRETGECMGRLSLGVISRLVYQFANLAYEVSNQHWGQGYAAEAARGIFPLAFKTLKLHRVEAGIEEHNLASRKVAIRAGMKLEGKREKYFFNGKKWSDLVYYCVTPEIIGLRPSKPTIKANLNELL